MFKRPNLFIIGAPKCGTTSLASWLAAHPNVFMSPRKELEFFDHDRRKGYSDTLARYERFFAKVKPEHRVIGEASTGYLRSRVAVDEILSYSPSSRFIVGIRNPVEMVISWHRQCVFEAWEDENDFACAWQMQDLRRRGLRIPKLCPDVNNLLYYEVCALGEQLSRLFSKASTESVFVYTLDEMRKDPASLWQRLLAFLALPCDGRGDFPALNSAKSIPRSLSVLTRLVADTKRQLGVSGLRLGVLNRLNTVFSSKPDTTVDKALVDELYESFKNETLTLQRLTGFDLTDWLRPTHQIVHDGIWLNSGQDFRNARGQTR